jgi:hypothetical protein
MASLVRDMFKGLVIAIGVLLLFALLLVGGFMWMMGGFDRTYSPSEMVESFEEHRSEMHELIHYFYSIVPEGKHVEIEFSSDDELGRFGFSPTSDTSMKYFLDWLVKTGSPKMDSARACLNWTVEQVDILKEKLDAADCIQIENTSEGTRLGFKRSGMHMYFFEIFNEPQSDSTIAAIEHWGSTLFASDTLAVQWLGGAIGVQSWPEKYRDDLK